MTYIFYDTETTGTETTFDQVLQFAAIRADDDLNITDKFDIRGRLLPHIVPSPGALMVTGVRIGDITRCPLTHFEMALRIHRKMTEWSQGGAMFLGWNSMRFDESLLRQTYYQSLLPVYQTNTNGNGRADVMRIAQIVSAAAPDVLKIPMRGGRPSFRLGEVAAANGVRLDDAHEALADTTATLEVAKLIRHRAPVIWKTLIANGRKAAVQHLIRRNATLLLAESYFGNRFAYVVSPVAANQLNDSEWAFFDLQYDPSPYLAEGPDRLRTAIESKAIRRVLINSQPGLLPVEFAPEDVQGGRLPLETYRERAKAISENRRFRENVASVLAELHAEKYGSAVPSVHVEERIHDGFPKPSDLKVMGSFHKGKWEDRARLIDAFDDSRYREIGLRIVAAGRAEALPDAQQRKWKRWWKDRITAPGDVPWFTIPKAIAEIAEREAEATKDQREQLSEIRSYLDLLSR